MPTIPRYQREISIPGTSGQVMMSPEAAAAPYAALSKAGEQVTALGEKGMELARWLDAANAEDQINRVKVEMYKDQAALKDKLMYTTDDAGNKILRSDYGNFESEAEQFSQQNLEKYRSMTQNPRAWERIQPVVALHQATNMTEARSLARKLNLAAITDAWTASIQDYQDLVAKAQSGEEAKDLGQKFADNTTNLIRTLALSADLGNRGIREVTVTGDMRRLYAEIEQNATGWRASQKNDITEPDNDLKERFPYLSETDFIKANKYAVDVANSEQWTKDRALKRLQDENANVVRDMYTAFDQGRMQYKDFIGKLRLMFAADENGVRKIDRQIIEYYEALAKSKINGDDKIPDNPVLYLKLADKILDKDDPLTIADLKPYIRQLKPSIIYHFAGAINQRDLADGRREGKEDEKKLAKAIDTAKKEEAKYIKVTLSNTKVESDVLWQLHQDVTDLIDTAYTSGQPVDRKKIHEEIQRKVEPIVTNWISRQFKKFFSDEPGGKAQSVSDIELALSAPKQQTAPAGPPAIPEGWKRNPAYPNDPTRFIDRNGKPRRWVP